MTKELIAFDYSGLDKDTKSKLLCLAGQIKRGKAHYVKAVIEVGAAIHEAHELLAGDGRDGRFSDWCENECGIERRTAYNYLWSFNRFGKCETVSHFSAGAMYALAAPTAPDKAVKEALRMADKGERVTKATADELLEKYTVDAKPKPSSETKPAANKTPQAASREPDKEETTAAEPADDGPCTKGGPHELDDERICMKCHEDDPELRIRIEAQNSAVESFAKSLLAAFASPPSDPWLDESRLNIAKDQIKSACATIRLAKAHEKACPKCNGKGCKTCRNCGYLPKSSYEAAGGQ